ncbi:MAG: hypothetical protein WA655_09535 [Candidatus Korobacteraceae bacterium]
MRVIILGTMLLAVIGLCGCKERRNAVVILNEQWSVNQAANDCQSRAWEGVALCAADPRAEIVASDVQLAKAFASEPACSGLTLLTLNFSEHQRPLNSRRTWWLFLELGRGLGSDERRFAVSRSDDPGAHGALTGQGKIDGIARSACEFVRGRTGGL